MVMTDTLSAQHGDVAGELKYFKNVCKLYFEFNKLYKCKFVPLS